MSRDLQEQQEQVQNLTKLGKEQGYLLYEQVNDFLASEEQSAEQIDNVFSVFEAEGINIYEDVLDAKAARAVSELAVQADARVQDEETRREESEVEQAPSAWRKDERSCARVPARNGRRAPLDP